MAKQRPSQQTWWPVYALALIMIGLLLLAHQLAPSSGWRIFLEFGVVVVGYSLMASWLETHSTKLLDRPSAEADNPEVKSPEEAMPPLLTPHVRCQFYTGSDPAIIYHMSEYAASNPRSNGNHHLASTIPPLPEETAKPFTNN